MKAYRLYKWWTTVGSLAALLLPVFLNPLPGNAFWPEKRRDTDTVNAGAKYYDIYLVNNQVCRHCVAIPIDPLNMQLVNRAGASIQVRNVDIMGVDNHPHWRKLLEGVVHETGIVGRAIAAPGYDPLGNWRESVQTRPTDNPINEPHD